MSTCRPAVFLDRDGTLIDDVGCLDDPSNIRLFPYTVDALRQLHEKYLLFVVTNQPGIAEGRVTAAQVAAVNRRLDKMLSQEGVHIKDWYVCPHARKDGCGCIKPNPAFLLQAAREHDIDLHRSFVIGDHPHDPATGDTIGVFGLYLLTGHGLRHLDELPPERLIFHSLKEAVQWVLKHPDRKDGLAREISDAAEAIKAGGIVVFPTETVYGLGADVFNIDAVARVFAAKKRPLHDPLIVHISDRKQLEPLVEMLPDRASQLIEAFWPGPLTLVLPKSAAVPEIVTAGNRTVAVRMPANPWANELIRMAGTPIAAPSANLFGRTSPTTAEHVDEQLSGCYDAIIDAGACRVGVESTVLSLVEDAPALLRPGGISREDIEAVIGPLPEQSTGPVGRTLSPGMLPSHYAPSTPLRIVEDAGIYSDRSDVGSILLRDCAVSLRGPVAVLSKDGNLKEAAVNLYAAIRRLDSMGLNLIVVERAPLVGIGKAINDRLLKASELPQHRQ